MKNKQILIKIEHINSATDEVLYHLSKKSITSLEAIKNYGVTRLAAIIYLLRKRGYNIVTQEFKMTTRYNRKTTLARYVYIPPID